MDQLARLAVFVTFVALSAATWFPSRWRSRRRPVILLIGFVLVMSVLAGVSRREIWPFATWSLVSAHAPSQVTNYDFELFTADGRSVRLDPRVWQPASDNEILDGWVAWHFATSTPAEKDDFVRFVLRRAEEARQRVRSGRRFAANERVLGPFAAPYAFQRRPLWLSADRVPPLPFIGARLIREEWDVWERFRNENAVRREVVHEIHRP